MIETVSLRGDLTKTAAYRGTICGIKKNQFEYLKNKILGIKSKQIQDIESDLTSLYKRVKPLIKGLTPYDFETLIDLIVTKSGYSRLGQVGGFQKDIDMHYSYGLSNKHMIVQVKTATSQKQFNEYDEIFASRISNNLEISAMYVFHTPSTLVSSENVKLMNIKTISEKVVDLGLVKWVMSKSS